MNTFSMHLKDLKNLPGIQEVQQVLALPSLQQVPKQRESLRPGHTSTLLSYYGTVS